jgi:hypothetical protein
MFFIVCLLSFIKTDIDAILETFLKFLLEIANSPIFQCFTKSNIAINQLISLLVISKLKLKVLLDSSKGIRNNEILNFCSSLPGGADGLGSSSLPVFSPGGHSLSYSYGRSMGVGSQRSRGGTLVTARGTGRKVTPVPKDKSDPLHGVRKKMPYEKLVKEIENNPEAEIRR